MTLYIVRRLLQSVLVILIMLVLVFIGVYVIGNPVDVMVSTEADQEEFERMVRLLGLDQPLWKQILVYISKLAQGAVIMRVVDLQLSFPTILVALILLAILGKGIFNVVLALVIVQWALYARTARGVALAERQKEYVDSAACLGLRPARIIVFHILPNCMPSLIVIATLEVAHAISLEATLSFLGLGLPVTQPSLGLLISNGFDYLLSGYPWISVLPGVALLIMMVAINLVGDELRDILNPRL